ncbi:type II toxin-antitoxin system YafQ family toxin [Aggregatibacter kilianii]|uniref:type II toxin-antitoxin system YafQ family toxin n=1 Tax=Aggregatibacter kilianii TaxID=2025884 RepID=UPI000D651AD5|nr:type II toxin-antitoxin system YafQ family toxin [Aggregatibacter kilianii]
MSNTQRELYYTNDFKRDLKKQSFQMATSPEYIEVMHCLLNRKVLPAKYKDHQLTGNMKDFRDCHIKNDLVLIYRLVDDDLHLIRLNTHSEIFG